MFISTKFGLFIERLETNFEFLDRGTRLKQNEKKQKRLTPSLKWGIGEQWRGEIRYSKSRDPGVNFRL